MSFMDINLQMYLEEEEKNKMPIKKPASFVMQASYKLLNEGETEMVENCKEHKNLLYNNANKDQHFEVTQKNDDSEEEEEDDDDEEEMKCSVFTAALSANAPLPSLLQMKPSDFYTKYVLRTPQQCLEEENAPQRSDKWLDARKYCITASQFGAAIGDSPYQTSDDVILEKLWNTFKGNSATEWGSLHENSAKDVFCEWFEKYMKKNYEDRIKNIEFIEKNLIKYADEPWIGVSPDGILKYTLDNQEIYELVEFKCPAYLKKTTHHPYAKHPKNIPSQYLAQIQGIMGYLNTHNPKHLQISRCWFVVWQPDKTWITLEPFNKTYYDAVHEKLEEFYFKKLLPAFTHKQNRLLAFGDFRPHEPIQVLHEE